MRKGVGQNLVWNIVFSAVPPVILGHYLGQAFAAFSIVPILSFINPAIRRYVSYITDSVVEYPHTLRSPDRQIICHCQQVSYSVSSVSCPFTCQLDKVSKRTPRLQVRSVFPFGFSADNRGHPAFHCCNPGTVGRCMSAYFRVRIVMRAQRPREYV